MIVHIELAGTLHKVKLERRIDGDGYLVWLEGKPLEVQANLLRPGVLSLLIGGAAYRCVLDENPEAPAIHVGRYRYPYRVEDPRALTSRRAKEESPAGPVSIKAPMPGRVVRLLVVENDEVASQQGIVVMEAMKMQNELKAPRTGRLVRILVEAGATVVSGQPLAILE